MENEHDTHINGPINCSGSLRNAIEYLLDEGVEEAEHIISKSVHENRKATIEPSTYCGVLTWIFSNARLGLRVLCPYRLTHPV